MGFIYTWKLCWLPKSVAVGASHWTKAVVLAETCPDQRTYRRLTRAERLRYQQEFSRPPKE